GHLTIDGFWLKLPIIGDLIKKTATARLCRTLGSLIHSGVDILTALEIVRNTAGNQLIAKVINDSRRDVQGGGMISVSLSRSAVLPTMAVQMISVGEETGELDQMLMKVAEFYEDEVEQTVKSLTSLLEPVMIILIGLMVGSILLAMYLPMFKVFEQAN
ncbi:MAG: type II secretion system F family protein, partial [Synechococcales cyanobacterium]